ncbi:hypothetical protein HDV06_005942 [Boothiomyces sp. JEL0866]|nr:hypothetical protein HDV06_005942 [Boothiomyces sp. JEL0866]
MFSKKQKDKSTTSLVSSSNESLSKKKKWISLNDIAKTLQVYTNGIDDSILDISYHRDAYEHEKK